MATNGFHHREEVSEEGLKQDRPVNLSQIDFCLRLLMFGASLAAVVVAVTSKQTEMVAGINPLTGQIVHVSRTAKFNHSPTVIYLVSSSAVACFYSLITMVVSVSSISKPLPSAKLLFRLAVLDLLMLGVMASAAGASGAVAYIGLKGDKHVNWGKICNVYDRFCLHIGSAIGLAFLAWGALAALVILSSYSLYRRCR